MITNKIIAYLFSYDCPAVSLSSSSAVYLIFLASCWFDKKYLFSTLLSIRQNSKPSFWRLYRGGQQTDTLFQQLVSHSCNLYFSKS